MNNINLRFFLSLILTDSINQSDSINSQKKKKNEGRTISAGPVLEARPRGTFPCWTGPRGARVRLHVIKRWISLGG